jgi:hypothetical protein
MLRMVGFATSTSKYLESVCEIFDPNFSFIEVSHNDHFVTTLQQALG